MKKTVIAILFLVVAITVGCNQRTSTYFEKELTFPEMVTGDQKVKTLRRTSFPHPNNWSGNSWN